MTELLLARGEMAMPFAFPIVFAVAGMGTLILFVFAEAAFREDTLSCRYRKSP